METGKAIIRIPGEIRKDVAFTIKFVIIHPMETGTRKDAASGKVVAAHHLTAIKLEFDGKPVADMTIGTGVSSNPTFGTMLKVNKSGMLKLSYQDNQGGSWEKTQEISIQAEK